MSKNHEIEQRAVIRYLMRKNKTGKNKSPYSPDLAPSDFHVFRKMKMDLKRKRFSSDNDVKAAVMAYRVGKKKNETLLMTWVPVNGFQCAIPCLKAHLMRFKIRYKVFHNYFPIILYRSNSLA